MGWFGTFNKFNAYTQTADAAKEDKSGPGRKRAAKIPGQVIREIRAVSEYLGWTPSMLESEYRMTKHQIKNILSGLTGAYLIHSESDLPVQHAGTSAR